MKKMILFSAVVLLATACARVDGEKTNQNPNFAAQARLAPRQAPVVQGQQAHATPAVPSTSTVCVANVVRSTQIKSVEKFERLSKSKIRVNPESSISSRMVTEIKFIAPYLKGGLVSREKVAGPVSDEPETYDFKNLKITTEQKKIRFVKADTRKNKSDKYLVNEADLTAEIFADIDFNEPQLIEFGQGFEKTCSFIAKGSFEVNESDKTIDIVINLTETFQLDNKAVSHLLKSSRNK